MPNTVAEQKALDAHDWLHVVAAVIFDADSRVLLAKRPDNKHQGGKWEFPGGKVEAGERAQFALVRELEEELGIVVSPDSLQPLIEVRHCYPDKAVFLDVWQARGFQGAPHGREGQEIGWFQLAALAEMEFPAANHAIIDKLLSVVSVVSTPSA